MQDLHIPSLPPALAEALESLYRRLDAEVASLGVGCWNHSLCCDFDSMEHRLYASLVEIAHVRGAHPEPLPLRGKLCPFWRAGRCAERARRPLGCRTYFCDRRYRDLLEAIHERYLAELRRLAEEHAFPWYYGDFVAAIVRPTP